MVNSFAHDRVGRSPHESRSSDGAATPGIDVGAGNGSRGSGPARIDFQNGVNTLNGVPDPVVTRHGSCSNDPV